MKQASRTPTDAETTSTSPLANRRASLLAIVLIGLTGAAPLSAATLTFTRVTENSPVDLSTDLTVEVTDLGGGLALFSINRGTGFEAFLRSIYFEDREDRLGTITFAPDFSSSGIAMDDPSRPAHPPGLSVFEVDSSFDADSPGPKNGIKTGETGAFIAAYSGSYVDLLDSLIDGTIRIAVHAQGIESPGDVCSGHDDDKSANQPDRYQDGYGGYQDGYGSYDSGGKQGPAEGNHSSPDCKDGGGGSDTYVTVAIPEPSSLVLLCLASLGLLRRVRR